MASDIGFVEYVCEQIRGCWPRVAPTDVRRVRGLLRRQGRRARLRQPALPEADGARQGTSRPGQGGAPVSGRQAVLPDRRAARRCRRRRRDCACNGRSTADAEGQDEYGTQRQNVEGQSRLDRQEISWREVEAMTLQLANRSDWAGSRAERCPAGNPGSNWLHRDTATMSMPRVSIDRTGRARVLSAADHPAAPRSPRPSPRSTAVRVRSLRVASARSGRSVGRSRRGSCLPFKQAAASPEIPRVVGDWHHGCSGLAGQQGTADAVPPRLPRRTRVPSGYTITPMPEANRSRPCCTTWLTAE